MHNSGGTTQFSADRFSYVYKVHNRNVQSYFADRPDDLLTLDITKGEGWEKLCPFLERPRPDKPFPHSNAGGGVDLYWQRMEGAISEIVEVVPVEEAFGLVDEGAFLAVTRFRTRAVRLPGGKASPGGAESDALAFLDQLHEQNIRFFVLSWFAFWRHDAHPGWVRTLHERYRVVSESENVQIYEKRT